MNAFIAGRLQHPCSQPNCHMRYQSYKDLKRHYQETGHRAKHVCFLCGDVAPRDVYLRNHIISVHLELKPYQCIHCPFTSALPDKIYNGHYKRIHGNGEVGTKQDVISLPNVLKAIEEFEKENKASLMGISMMPPPLEDWPCKGDTTDSDATPVKKPRRSMKEDAANNIKQEQHAFDEMAEVKSMAYSPSDGTFDDEQLTLSLAPHPERAVIDVKPSKQKALGKFRQQCDICLFSFESKESFEKDVEKHQQQCLNNEVVQCPTCAVTVPKVDLNRHYTTDHAELKAGCCLDCLVVAVERKGQR